MAAEPRGAHVSMKAADGGGAPASAGDEPAEGSGLSPEDEQIARDRMAQIQAAIRRGEERAARAEEDGKPIAPRQLTPEEEELLAKLTTQLNPDGDDAEDSSVANDMVVDAEVSEFSPLAGPLAGLVKEPEVDDAIEVRMRKTLEFCPDGRLARDILLELQAETTRNGKPGPGAGAYDEVIEAFSKQGALDDALALFQEMQKARIGATDRTYDALARPAARGGEYRFVEMLYGAKAADKQGDIGAASLALLLEAYANGLPRQVERAESSFRSAMDLARERQEDAPASLARELAGVQVATELVLAALRRAVGPERFDALMEEYGLDPDESSVAT